MQPFAVIWSQLPEELVVPAHVCQEPVLLTNFAADVFASTLLEPVKKSVKDSSVADWLKSPVVMIEDALKPLTKVVNSALWDS